MIKQTFTVARRFYAYQAERFPMVVLALSLFPAILSSGVIVSSDPRIFQGALALIASLAYLLHIRVIDEHRDFEHDNQHHPTRPIQGGVISRRELLAVDIVAVSLLLIVAVVAGPWALVTAGIMLAYSYLAGKEFFIGEGIRGHFFVYNGVNLIQMLLMQVFVYTVFANPFPFSAIVWAHFLFTTIGTSVFEFVRKVKRPGDDGTGKDTYTWYLGFSNSLIVYSFLLLVDTLLFFWIATLITPDTMYALLLAAVLAAAALLTVVVHWVKRTRRSDQLMQLSFLLLYGVLNIVVYFLALN